MREFLRGLMCVLSGLGIFFVLCFMLAVFNHGELNFGPFSTLILSFSSIFLAVILDFFANEDY